MGRIETQPDLLALFVRDHRGDFERSLGWKGELEPYRLRDGYRRSRMQQHSALADIPAFAFVALILGMNMYRHGEIAPGMAPLL